ncbi:MAG: hypothetical protein AAGI44_17990 [Pseudomonadota bacterium]
MIEHRLYGASVFSQFPLYQANANLILPAPWNATPIELRECSAGRDRDQRWASLPVVESLRSSHGRSLFLHTDKKQNDSSSGHSWRFHVADIVSFAWKGGDGVIEYQLHNLGSMDLLVFWFVHIFLPLHLTLESDYDFMHASAVVAEEQSILFLAPSAGGKSTLVDYFLGQGHRLLSDDKVAIGSTEGGLFAIPSHPHHRPWREHEVLGNSVKQFASEPVSVQAFYVLKRAEPDVRMEISEITGFRKFEELQPNYLYDFQFLKKKRLHWLATLADQSLIYQVIRPWNLDRMGEVYDTICEHSRGLKQSLT